MDWLRSALNDDTSSDEEGLGNAADVAAGSSNRNIEIKESSTSSEQKDDHIAHTDVDYGVNEAAEADTLSKDVEGGQDRESLDVSPPPQSVPEPLFSFATSRQAEDYSKAEIIRINPPQLSEEDLRELEAPVGDDPSHEDSHLDATGVQPEQESLNSRQKGSLDTLEIMQRFNMIHSGSNIKAPKQRDWFGSDIRVTEINADDLRMGKNEKSASYSTSKAALLEGRTAFQAPARRLETDDGHVLTTNVMRKTSKRKHQISWLAADAQERELELLERTAQARKTKHETQMKYGCALKTQSTLKFVSLHVSGGTVADYRRQSRITSERESWTCWGHSDPCKAGEGSASWGACASELSAGAEEVEATAGTTH
ncbi:PAP 25A-associated domain-containing protein, putative [Babesia ovata]|uniref:PAP 25A-associated domain-containing protein, putative n=1 Tax=Babesia ovata TaxID=189622 RepID=A0A2H6KCN6_9APIC|nr:PAP 25A-associated domain-containing protein, putative [Babesia ovata]GBE60752.1 PAP 25A-associated domain-containing protein, putative [Babesia ovata]